VTGDEESSCRELAELVTEYLEEALTPAERAAYERHLQRCGDCSRHLEQMRQTIAALGALPQQPLPDSARKQLLTSFRAWVADCR
jgi:anti-sigma factor RsiW